MKALILNSGLGHRMGDITKSHPKCMTPIPGNDTILSRQLRLVKEAGIREVIITTGYFDQVLVDYCNGLQTGLDITFVKNPIYDQTNYIYSIYCAKELLEDDLLLMHGDLVFEQSVLEDMLKVQHSCMKVSSTLPLPEKDFKAVVRKGRVYAVGVEFFEEAMEAQALYRLTGTEWQKWLDQIAHYCESDRRNCYAEVAFNEISDRCEIYAFDAGDRLCTEIDNPEDLAGVSERLEEIIRKGEE